MQMRYVVVGIVAFVASVICNPVQAASWWNVQSIDTMKYSRDMARQVLHDQAYDRQIDAQMKSIAATGVTHVAIATPYDEEFYPVLKRWVDSAHRHGLHVWFRGNWSGWEGWFDYAKITRAQHMQKTKDFLEKHKDLFQDGDIFTACPECENGGPGDPRATGDVVGYRAFIVNEYQMTKNEFTKMHKNIASNWQSMNADVARVVMDHATTTSMDGLVVIDHYVMDPASIARDVEAIATQSGGMVALGEFGAPIPDIHGAMTESQQAGWIDSAMKNLLNAKHLAGLSYWVNMGGSTQLWNDDGSARSAVATLESYYSPKNVHGVISGLFGRGIPGAIITSSEGKMATADKSGVFDIPYMNAKTVSFHISASPYTSRDVSLLTISNSPKSVVSMQIHGFIDWIIILSGHISKLLF